MLEDGFPCWQRNIAVTVRETPGRTTISQRKRSRLQFHQKPKLAIYGTRRRRLSAMIDPFSESVVGRLPNSYFRQAAERYSENIGRSRRRYSQK